MWHLSSFNAEKSGVPKPVNHWRTIMKLHGTRTTGVTTANAHFRIATGSQSFLSDHADTKGNGGAQSMAGVNAAGHYTGSGIAAVGA